MSSGGIRPGVAARGRSRWWGWRWLDGFGCLTWIPIFIGMTGLESGCRFKNDSSPPFKKHPTKTVIPVEAGIQVHVVTWVPAGACPRMIESVAGTTC